MLSVLARGGFLRPSAAPSTARCAGQVLSWSCPPAAPGFPAVLPHFESAPGALLPGPGCPPTGPTIFQSDRESRSGHIQSQLQPESRQPSKSTYRHWTAAPHDTAPASVRLHRPYRLPPGEARKDCKDSSLFSRKSGVSIISLNARDTAEPGLWTQFECLVNEQARIAADRRRRYSELLLECTVNAPLGTCLP